MSRVLSFGCSLVATAAILVSPCRADPPLARHFGAHLTGAQETPPRVTLAQGQAVFQLSGDGNELRYHVSVAAIRNVVAVNIETANGTVLVGLFAAPPGGGPANGVLARGTFANPSSSLIAAMRAGNVYVNVRTNDGVAPPNTGPGDFPGGEIRGPIRAAGR